MDHRGFACIPIFSVNDVLDGEDIQEPKPKSQRVVTDDSSGNSVEGSHRSVYLFNTSRMAKLIIVRIFTEFERVFNLCIYIFISVLSIYSLI